MKQSFLPLLAFTLSLFFSCNNKKDDPTPSNPNSPTNTPPTISASANPTTSTAPATVIITATASDVDGTITKVQFIKNGNIEMEDVSAPYEYSISSLNAGTYVYTVKAFDNGGAYSTTTVTFTVNTNTTNSAPTFTGSAVSVASDGTSKVVSLASLVNDADGNTITIASISPMTGVSSINGLQFTVTPSNSVFAGAVDYSVTITDGTSNTTSTITVKIGDNSQISTYSILSAYFGRGLNTVGIVSNTFLNAGSITTTGTQPSGGFFTSTTSAGTYNYTINSGGTVTFSANNMTTTYSVQVINSALVFTDVNRANKIYKLY